MKKTILLLMSGALLVFAMGAFAQDNNAGPTDVNIHIRDYCDPTSFNAAVGAGTCERDTTNGTITFPGFIAEIQADKSAGAWRFVPEQVKIAEGATLHVSNLGGETHTFTEVKRFGGGVVPILNELSGNTVVAPECLESESEDNIFLAAGASATVTEHEGVARYQCCIHPWMRLTITPRDQHHAEVR